MNRSKQAGMVAKSIIVVWLVGLALASVHRAEAQQPKKSRGSGLVRPGSPPDPYVDAFRQGLRDLGYVEGKNIAIEYRWAEGKSARLPVLAAELVRLKVDIIVTQGEVATRAVKDMTSTIPIVMATVADPVGAGIVASLASPSGNVTGQGGCPQSLPCGHSFQSDHFRSSPRR